MSQHSNMTEHKSIFVPMIGQHENIGDIILRRPLLDWLRSEGTVHTFVGKAPPGYAEALGVRSVDVVYHSFLAWYWAGLKSAARGRAHYAFKPGEIQMSLAGLKEHISMLPLLMLIRLTGGKVVRVGSGARNFAQWPRLLMMPSVWLSHLVAWRDARTTAFVGVGETMPDLGFTEGRAEDELAALPRRDALVLSMRGDREDQSDQWIEAVEQFARTRGLTVWVVTQVHRDSTLSRRLAQRLGANLLDWNGLNHDAQERELRALYDRTDVVVSDRLHVLIAAFTHGAAPVGLLPYSSDKIERHFNAAGVSDVCVVVDGMDTASICAAMDEKTADRDRFQAGLVNARTKLRSVKARIKALLSVS